jgi:hypothetical protein
MLADGMWVIHLMWGCMSLGSLGAGLWMCQASTLPSDVGAQGGLAVSGLMFILFSIVPFFLWRGAARSIVLTEEGLRDRRGFAGRAVLPYADMAFVGVRPAKGMVLEVWRDTRRERMQFAIPLPRWAASHDGFLEELRARAPGIEVGNESDMRRYSFTTFVAGLWFTVMMAALALSPCLYVPVLMAKLPWLTVGRLIGGFAGATVLLWVYQWSGVRRIGTRS